MWFEGYFLKQTFWGWGDPPPMLGKNGQITPFSECLFWWASMSVEIEIQMHIYVKLRYKYEFKNVFEGSNLD